VLFGILAVCARRLDPAQLADAYRSWLASGTGSLADLLEQQGHLSPETRAELEREVGREFQQSTVDDEGSPRAEYSLSTGPDCAAPVPETPPTTEERRGRHREAALPSDGKRYVLNELHAQGGIGRVWRAQDLSLGREVALKDLRPDRAGSAALVTRFFEEARITGRLEHPGIVPIYEMARHPVSEEPFYTMRFIRGRTLREATREYSERRKQGRASPLVLRELLSAFVAVCNTVAYAHSRGVVHRDLKGSNVVLGDFGEVIVLDWGLAKTVGAKAVEGEEVSGDLFAAGAEGQVLTQAGQILGTPGYMSPEQAEGRPDAIDQRSDVFSLGAILYEILTGSAPFTGASLHEVVRRTLSGPPALPGALAPGVPKAMESVCLKALSRDPRQRYATALELAQEVRRWLADEPVGAHRESLRARAGRWVRRHHALAAGLGVLLLTTVIFLAVIAGLTEQGRRSLKTEKENTEQARDEAAENFNTALAQRERAEANFQKAIDAVDTMLTRVGSERLADIPMMTPVRRKLLEDALSFYQEAFKTEDQRPQVRFRKAHGHLMVATCYAHLGQVKSARAHIQEGLATLEELSKELADNTRVKHEIATAHAQLSYLEWENGQMRLAVEVGELAVRQLKELRSDPGSGPQVEFEWLSAKDILAQSYFGDGRFKEAEKLFLEVRTGFQRLAGQSSAEEVHYRLAASRHNLAECYERLHRVPEAIAEFRKTLDVQQKLMDDHPHVPRFRRDHGNTLMHLGTTLLETEALTESGKVLTQAGEVFDRLRKEFPSIAHYAVLEAAARHNLGALLWRTNRLPEAEKAFRESIQLLEKEKDRTGELTSRARADLANSYSRLGGTQQSQGKLAEAEKSLRRACELFTKLHENARLEVSYLTQAAAALHNLAQLIQDRGLLEEAKECYQKSLELGKQLKDEAGQIPQVKHDRGNTWMRLGDLLAKLGDRKGAEEAMKEALHLLEQLAAEKPVPQFVVQHSAAHHNYASLLRTWERYDEAEKHYLKARDILLKLLKAGGAIPVVRRDLANTWRELAETLLARNQPVEATKAYAESEKLWSGLVRQYPDVPDLKAGLAMTSSQKLLAEGKHARAAEIAANLARDAGERYVDAYNAACLYSRCIPVAEKDSTLSAEKKKNIAANYEEQGMKLLRLTTNKHVTTAEDLRTDPDLKPLRGRPPFEALLKELGAQKPKQGK
jgi:serine/threonine-protein kinase